MKKIYFKISILLMGTILYSCQKDEVIHENQKEEIRQEKQLTSNQSKASIGSKVMMQAFYWDVPAGGNWWNTVSSKVPEWSAAGIDAIWLPPASKAQNGEFSMGYDPFDYYDFGDYDQMGSVETRFGSRSELEN